MVNSNVPVSLILTTTAHLIGSPCSSNFIEPVMPSKAGDGGHAFTNGFAIFFQFSGQLASILNGLEDDASRIPGQCGDIIRH